MMESRRHWVSTHRIARGALLTMTMTLAAACWADVPDAVVDPAPSGAAVRRPGHHGSVRRLTVAQRIDASVGRLTRGLDLDAAQQVRLRQILVDQHRQVMQLRSAGSTGTGPVLAISDQTKAKIRAMLNDEQKKRYSADVAPDGLGPAQADLQHWMQVQDAKRQQGAEDLK